MHFMPFSRVKLTFCCGAWMRHRGRAQVGIMKLPQRVQLNRFRMKFFPLWQKCHRYAVRRTSNLRFGGLGQQMKLRTILIAVMTSCAVSALCLPVHPAFAGVVAAPLNPPPPPPAAHAYVPAWWWASFACPASIVLSSLVADFRDNRQLTTPEAWTCGLLYWIPMPTPPQPPVRHHP